MRIFVTGLTSVRVGLMEHTNLGNLAIAEPLFDSLRRTFPESEIVSTLQMSEEFCDRFALRCLRGRRFWTYGTRTLIITLADLLRAALIVTILRPVPRARRLVARTSGLLRELYEADLMVDFSGDLYGDNVKWRKFVEGSARILVARMVGIPVAVIAGSPGPFGSRWRRWLARFTLNRATLITNREPISTELLARLGIGPELVRTTACPAFLFQAAPPAAVDSVLEREGIERDATKPLVGVIVSGWNMPAPPYHRTPREDWELSPFLEMLRHLRDVEGVQLLLMSHAHRLDDHGESVPGADAVIAEQLHSALMADGPEAPHAALIRGAYDAATMKAIIGRLDMLVSGRIHGAVAGLSQGVPTAIIDYGHEPRAHKLRGFARVVDLGQIICDPSRGKDLVAGVSRVWHDRVRISQHLHDRMPGVRDRARSNFDLLSTLVNRVGAPGGDRARLVARKEAGVR